MRTTKSTMAALLLALPLLAACSDSGGGEYAAPAQTMKIYPATLVETSTAKDGTESNVKWSFTYDSKNRITAYTYTAEIKSGTTTIVQTEQGNLSYSVNIDNKNYIANEKSSTYKFYNPADPTNNSEYREEMNETATLNANGLIENIVVYAKRISDTDETAYRWDERHNYAYDNNSHCTTYTRVSNQSNKTSTSRCLYTWSNDCLTKAVEDYNDYNNDATNSTYTYQYDTKNRATKYTFNISGFIVGPGPQVYSAMGLMGRGSEYVLQSQQRNGYRTIGGVRYEDNPVSKSFNFYDNATQGSVTVVVNSPSYTEYSYTFK